MLEQLEQGSERQAWTKGLRPTGSWHAANTSLFMMSQTTDEQAGVGTKVVLGVELDGAVLKLVAAELVVGPGVVTGVGQSPFTHSGAVVLHVCICPLGDRQSLS